MSNIIVDEKHIQKLAQIEHKNFKSGDWVVLKYHNRRERLCRIVDVQVRWVDKYYNEYNQPTLDDIDVYRIGDLCTIKYHDDFGQPMTRVEVFDEEYLVHLKKYIERTRNKLSGWEEMFINK